MKKNNRRKFIRNLGMGAASLLSVPAIASGVSSSDPVGEAGQEKKKTGLPVSLGKDVQIDLQLSAGNDFMGLGAVRIGGTLVRDPSIPMLCDVRSPEGIQVTGLPVLEKTISPERIFVKMGVRTRRIPVMEYMLHSVRNRENLYGWVQEEEQHPDTTVTLELLPVHRTIGGRDYQGFSYQYGFSSESFSIFKILDRGSWEIDGHSIGNECWQRVGHVPSIVRMQSADQRYSTENYYKGIANPNVFQFLPLQTELQGFTFLAHEKGILVSWATEIAHVRTLLEKPAGSDHIYHFHQHCNDLSSNFRTSPVEVLWLSQPGTERTDRYNIYEEVRSELSGHLHERAGIRKERVSTYGMIEQWDEPDFDHYTEVILPQLAAKGIKRLFLPNEFQNNMNVWGLSNMCCNVDFKFSQVADADKIGRFCKRAAAAGIRVDMWGNTAISTLTEIFQRRDGHEKGIHFLPEEDSITAVIKRARDPFVRNPSNAIEADHYTPVFAVLNLRDPDIRAYWMKQWKMAFDAGINGIFWDSSFNMSSDKFHFVQNARHWEEEDAEDSGSGTQRFYRPERPVKSAILTQYHAFLEWVKEMQEMGYSYCGEDLGVFGVHRHGPDLDMFADCMPLFGESFMDFDERLARKIGRDPLDVYFRGLAYRIVWMIRWDFKAGKVSSGISDERAYAFLRAFNEVNEHMIVRRILPGEKAVVYSSGDGGGTEVYWVFEPLSIKLEGKRQVLNLLTGEKKYRHSLDAGPFSIYLVQK